MNSIPRVSVEELSPSMMEELLARSSMKPVSKVFGLGFQLEGHINAVCKDMGSEEVVWQIDQPNIITDLGRRFWMNIAFGHQFIATSPSSDTPNLSRYTLCDNGSANSSQSTSQIAPTNNPSTLTKTFSTSFSAPTANRTIGTIGLGQYTNLHGLGLIVCYSLISPPKTQTTTQTLEITYRLTMTPVA
jgi:hypothetical protein